MAGPTKNSPNKLSERIFFIEISLVKMIDLFYDLKPAKKEHFIYKKKYLTNLINMCKDKTDFP